MTIRRICKDDCGCFLDTCEPKFDICPYCNEKLLLKFYFLRDISGKYESYVLENGKKIIGIMCFNFDEDGVYLSRIGVQHEKQDEGYGKELLDHLLKVIVKKRIERIWCKVHQEKLEWFTAKGFKEFNSYIDEHWGKTMEVELNIKYSA